MGYELPNDGPHVPRLLAGVEFPVKVSELSEFAIIFMSLNGLVHICLFSYLFNVMVYLLCHCGYDSFLASTGLMSSWYSNYIAGMHFRVQ